MHKFTIRVDREDQYRALLTDTSPYDTPIIFGNDEFYKSYKKFTGGDSAITEDVINCVFNGGGGAWKMPFVYKINKDNGGIRSISLVHPSSQINYANFYRSYEGLICHYCNKSPFTIRAPEKVGNKYYTGNYRKGLIKFRDNNVTTVFEDLISKYAKSYFAYKGYKRIFNFIDSREFINLERKFGNLVCADISKCFDTIYTHSLSWSVKNKRFSKKRSDFSSFPDDFDKVIRDSNYGETNGIPIGSEFSRIFSEILLQGVDMKIIKSLEGEGIFYGRDYSIRRYVDDFFIFSLTKDIGNL